MIARTSGFCSVITTASKQSPIGLAQFMPFVRATGSKLRMRASCDHRDWPATSIIDWVGHALTVKRRQHPKVGRQHVIDFNHPRRLPDEKVGHHQSRRCIRSRRNKPGAPRKMLASSIVAAHGPRWVDHILLIAPNGPAIFSRRSDKTPAVPSPRPGRFDASGSGPRPQV
jgi:hypothetical protein